MLNEHDRKILEEIEASLIRESPELARTLNRPGRLPRWLYDLAVVIGGATTVVCWVLHEHGTFDEGMVAASLAALIAAVRHGNYNYRLRRLHLRDDWFEPF